MPACGAAVEPLPGHRVGEPEVGTAVDDHDLLSQLRGDRAGLAVRQGQEDHVVAGQGLDGGLLEDPLGQRHEVRLEAAERLRRVGGTGQRADLDLGVGQQQPQQLTAGVPAGSGDRDPGPGHVHDYTYVCMCMQTRVASVGRRTSSAAGVMPTMPAEFPTYLDHIRTESARFREVLADCDPSARVPACPDWDAADLLWHLAGVQVFWAKVVRHRPGRARRRSTSRSPSGPSPTPSCSRPSTTSPTPW